MERDPLIIEEVENVFSSIGLFRLFKDEPYLFLLDSGIDPSSHMHADMGAWLRRTSRQKLGRYSFLGFDPFLIFRSKEDRITIIEENKRKELTGHNPFYVLKDLLGRYKLDSKETSIPFTGGAVGYFAYDLRRHLEDVPSNAVDDIDIPDCCVLFYDRVIIFDHLKDKTYIASSGFPLIKNCERSKRARMRFHDVAGRIEKRCVTRREQIEKKDLLSETRLDSNFTKDEYIYAINKAKEYIKKGDIYQVNLSQRFSCKIDVPANALFERLRAINPAPFASFLDFKDVKIVSASPERFLCKRGRSIHTRPIKGTRPRGAGFIEDERLKSELLSSPKERAEHIMIVDLERNDLGRICEYGTVLPTEFITLERYSTVFHLVSTVSGVLREGVDAADCLINCFPGGSITGAPKIRSMEIIDELEPTKRSLYTGSIGYIGFNGNMDTSIVIRTFIIKGDQVYFQVGGGIVADSDPEMEYQETLDKAKALIEALNTKYVSKSLAYSG